MRRGSRKKTIYKVKPDNCVSCCIIITSASNLYAQNLINRGCKEHCGQKVKAINNNKLKNFDDQINIESKNSCLNKSLCRG